MPAKKPLELVRKHYTKAELAERKASEVKHDKPTKITPPKYLSDAVKKEYKTIAKKLIALNIFADADSDMLGQYISAKNTWVSAQSRANKAILTGNVDEAGEWTKIANVYFKQCQMCAQALGLSITSRCRLVMPPAKEKEPEDAMSKMLRARQQKQA